MQMKPEPAAEEKIVVSELYHENSKQRRNDLEFNRRINLVNSNPDFHRVIARSFKNYPGASVTKLPAVEPQDGLSYERAAALRRSIRRFSGAPLRIEELARLVYFGSGLTGHLEASEHDIVQPVRAAPSGGALYPIELYAAVLQVDGMESGIYHYAVDRHLMELLRPGNFANMLSDTTSDLATFAHAAVVFVLSGAFGRSHFKYGERGYRFAMLEAGHIAQNILLAATARGLGAVAVGGFIDEEVNDLLDLDGVDEAAIYMIAAGHPAPRPTPSVEQRQEIVDRLLGELWGRNGGD
jgi:SagB-type dehydrogenase family enzyme